MIFDFNKQQGKIIFTTGHKKEWIKVKDILYITIDLTLSSVFVQYRTNPYYLARQLVELEAELGDYGFFRANKNTLVNGGFIKNLEKENKNHIIRLQDGKRIILLRRQYSKMRKIIKK